MLLALLYGIVLSQTPTEEFKDFANYLIYAEYSGIRLLSFINQGLLPTMSNEPLWLLVNAGLGSLLPPESTVRLIIFFSATTVAWLTLKNKPEYFFWLIVFMLLPNVIKNFLIHLRQGFAIAIFLLGWFSASPTRRWFLMGLAPFIHASFFFILFLLIMVRAMTGVRLGYDVRAIVTAALAISIGLGVGWLASLMGARQAQEYEFVMTDVSGLGFLIWLTILVVFLLQGKQFLRNHAFEMSAIVFYLGTYWFVEVTARIFESAVLLVLLAGLQLTGWRLFAYKSIVLFLLFGLSWVMRAGQPVLGFGVI